MSAPTFATDSDARELSQGLHVRVVSEPQEHNRNSKAPVRKELTGLTQRWCWDISCLLTFQKGEYLYLWLSFLDEYSRKGVRFEVTGDIQWRIAWHQTGGDTKRYSVYRIGLQHCKAGPGISRPLSG
jgi:hypothetical protein